MPVLLPGLIIILASTGLTSVDDLKQLLVIGVFASNTFGEGRGGEGRGGSGCRQLLALHQNILVRGSQQLFRRAQVARCPWGTGCTLSLGETFDIVKSALHCLQLFSLPLQVWSLDCCSWGMDW